MFQGSFWSRMLKLSKSTHFSNLFTSLFFFLKLYLSKTFNFPAMQLNLKEKKHHSPAWRISGQVMLWWITAFECPRRALNRFVVFVWSQMCFSDVSEQHGDLCSVVMLTECIASRFMSFKTQSYFYFLHKFKCDASLSFASHCAAMLKEIIANR